MSEVTTSATVPTPTTDASLEEVRSTQHQPPPETTAEEVTTVANDKPTPTTQPQATAQLSAPKPEPGATPIPADMAPASSDATPAPTPAAAPVPVQLPSNETPTTTMKGGETAPSTVPTVTPVIDTKVPSPQDTKEEVAEPQSTLTKQFTEAEWKALKEFRAKLPEIFAQGYPDNPKAKDTPITFWGVRIDPHDPIDARVSVVLMKFLRARNLSIREATEMLVSTLRWRETFGVEAAMKENFPEDIFGQVGLIYGRDKGGRPVVYNIYGGNKDLKAVFGDVQRFLRWRVALMEKSIAMLDFTEIDQTVQVHDYEGVSLTSRDANSKNAASEASSIFQGHYPELLHKKFFVNVPTLLNWIFWAFKPLIAAKTLEKMSVVGTGHHAIGKALLPVIDARELPKRYGGEAEAF